MVYIRRMTFLHSATFLFFFLITHDTTPTRRGRCLHSTWNTPKAAPFHRCTISGPPFSFFLPPFLSPPFSCYLCLSSASLPYSRVASIVRIPYKSTSLYFRPFCHLPVTHFTNIPSSLISRHFFRLVFASRLWTSFPVSIFVKLHLISSFLISNAFFISLFFAPSHLFKARVCQVVSSRTVNGKRTREICVSESTSASVYLLERFFSSDNQQPRSS